ncbi:MAG: hypothetical protein P8P36_09815 [Akkermansiaceae bacterium]|nr:hypothetical protein [Akkermansiaceae bacterium]
MSDSIKPSKVSFPCKFCQKSIHVPAGLSAITAPCPYCGKEVTSPDFSELEKLDSKPAAIDKNDDVESSVPVQGAAHKKPVILGGDGTTIKKTSDLAHAETKSNEVGVGSGNEARFVWIVLIVLLSVIIGLAAWLAYQDEGAVVEGGLQAEAEGSVTAEELRQEWITHGWKKEASQVLAGFMAAKSIDERMKYAIANDGVLDDLREFYPPGSDDRDTPIEFFAHRSGAIQDHERGIFRMQYRQPGQVELSEYFAPIGTLDKIMEIKGATLIDMAYAIDKSNVSAPIAVVAFFKGTEEGLKLDASIFIQGKFRTFRSFVDYPKLGHKKIFRVAISESIDHELRDDQQYRSYRIQDFAYPEEHVNVAVKADSKIGRALADINWRGMNREYQSRNATIELGWSKDKPARLQIERFICWEFLGVGGADGKASKQAAELTKDPQKSSE